MRFLEFLFLVLSFCIFVAIVTEARGGRPSQQAQTCSRRTAVVAAHALGSDGQFPSDTIAALNHSLSLGFLTLAEFDVIFTSDRVAVALHDRDLSVRTNGTGFVD
jgi:glycerophosphoryl diester phosphodiesterase